MSQRRFPSVGRPPCDNWEPPSNRGRPSFSVKLTSTNRGWPSFLNLRFIDFRIFFNPPEAASSALRAQRSQAKCSRRTASPSFGGEPAIEVGVAAAPRARSFRTSVFDALSAAWRACSLTSLFDTASIPAQAERAEDSPNRRRIADTLFRCSSGQIFISAKERLSLKGCFLFLGHRIEPKKWMCKSRSAKVHVGTKCSRQGPASTLYRSSVKGKTGIMP